MNAMISRTGVLVELCIRVIGHLPRESLLRYDDDRDRIFQKALQNVIARAPRTGGDISFNMSRQFIALPNTHFDLLWKALRYIILP